MNKFLSNYVNSLSTRDERKVAYILSEAKLDKARLATLLERLTNQSQIFPTIVLPKEGSGRLIQAGLMNNNVSTINVSLQEIFDVSNQVSLLLDGSKNVLNSEVEALEEELQALEKSVENYAFLLGDGKTYDYAFLESFNDEIERELDLDNWNLTDRSSQDFYDYEQAYVNTEETALTIFGLLNNSYPLSANVYKTNNSTYHSDTGIESVTQPTNETGWRRTISADRVISNTLPEFVGLFDTARPGAQAIVELNLAEAGLCDTIALRPLADYPVDIVKIEVFESASDSEGRNLIFSPITLNSARSFTFPVQTVSKAHVYVHQYMFERLLEDDTVLESEAYYKSLSDHFLREIYPEGYSLSTQYLKRMAFIFAEINQTLDDYNKANPNDRGGEREFTNLFEALRKTRKLHISDSFDNENVAGAFLMRAIQKLAVNDFEYIFGRSPYQNRSPWGLRANNPDDPRYGNIQPRPSLSANTLGDGNLGNTAQQQPDTSAAAAVQDSIGVMKYKYTLGLKTVELGSSATAARGLYISKQLPSPGDAGVVRLKAVYDLPYDDDPTRNDNGQQASVEFSVTNRAIPKTESNWIPILPSGEEEVTGERVLPDGIGKAFLRFAASVRDPIALYKNGKSMDINLESAFIYSENRDYIRGVTLPKNSFTDFDVLTIDYVPATDFSVVDFENYGFGDVPLSSAFDSDGSGEGFYGTGGQLAVSLAQSPFIDYFQVERSIYDEELGLAPYNPITISLPDGTNAVNLTNYKENGPAQTPLNPESDNVEFIHMDKFLTFNRAIEGHFRVYYQFLPSNLRFRVVMRSSDASFVTPRVDAVQIKAKIRKPDARRGV